MTTENSQRTEDIRPRLKFSGVWFKYDAITVIEDISFSVHHGEFSAILGPNGSGKTTLLKLALGLVKPTQGRIELLGKSPDRFRAWEGVGYVPQTVDGLFSRFPATVEEVVVQGLYKGFDPLAIWRSNRQEAVVEALETTGVGHLARRRVSSLSVGQQQRILVARALVRRPELLVLDEPVAGVDTAGQEQFFAMLRRLNSEQGLTVLMVSHDIGAVMREATTVACINRTLVFHGPPHGITQKELSTLYGLPMDVLLHDGLHEHR